MDPDFFQNFAWTTYEHLREVGIALVLLISTIAIMFSMLRPSGGDVGSIFIRAGIALFVLLFFKTLIEGGKDFMWSVEQSITGGGAIEFSVHKFLHGIEAGSFFSNADGAIRAYIGSILLTIATGIAEFIFALYNFIWVFVVVSGPFLIPLLILEDLGGIFKIYANVVLALLFARVPWAVLTLLVDNLAEYLKSQSTGDVRAFFLFITTLFIIAISPLATVLLVVKGGSFMGHISKLGELTATGTFSMAAQGVDKIANFQGAGSNAPKPLSRKYEEKEA
jgi:hypothetical protein